MATLAQIWRHPIKAHGVEALDAVGLIAGRTMPWDRAWAVTHDAARIDGSEWAHCANFSRGAKAPSLMAISAVLDEASLSVTLTHPDRPPLRFMPDGDVSAFLTWVAPLMPAERAQSARIVRVEGRGMTDTPFPSLSLLNLASLRELSARIGQDLSPLRFRGNFWVDGLPAWAEFDLIGKRLRLGEAEFLVRQRITRCLATGANPLTGQHDADTLGALQAGWGHRDFGIYAEVVKSGRVATGDRLEVL